MEAVGRGGLAATEGLVGEEGQVDLVDSEGVEDRAIMGDLGVAGIVMVIAVVIADSFPGCLSAVS